MDQEGKNLTMLQRLHEWRVEHVSERMFMLILAFLVGFFAAVAAFTLHWIINQIVMLLTSSFEKSTYNWLYLVYPVIGIYLTSLFVRYIVKDNISHGITRILYAISSNKSRLKSHNCWSSVIASAITIGFGGSVGAEAPIVLTGSAIGSNLGQAFHMDRKMLMTLWRCRCYCRNLQGSDSRTCIYSRGAADRYDYVGDVADSYIMCYGYMLHIYLQGGCSLVYLPS